MIILIQFQTTSQNCGTPLECYTAAIDTLNQDRQEMKNNAQNLSNKIEELKADEKKTILELKEEQKKTVQGLENKIQELKTEISNKKVQVRRRQLVLAENINYNGITITSNYKIPNLSEKTFAIIIQVNFVYGGAASKHGYITGKFVQSGNIDVPDYQVRFNHQHYNWYYNTEVQEYVVPWDHTKGEFLSMIVESSYNTDAKNTYSVVYVGEFTN